MTSRVTSAYTTACFCANVTLGGSPPLADGRPSIDVETHHDSSPKKQ